MKTKTQETTWYSSHNFSLNLNPVYSHAPPSLIMGQKAFPQVNRVLGIIPVCVCVCEGRIKRHSSTDLTHLLLFCLSYILRKAYALENVKDQLHQVYRAEMPLKLDCLAQFHIPSLPLQRKERKPHFQGLIPNFQASSWKFPLWVYHIMRPWFSEGFAVGNRQLQRGS